MPNDRVYGGEDHTSWSFFKIFFWFTAVVALISVGVMLMLYGSIAYLLIHVANAI